jgi:hypothetical protein
MRLWETAKDWLIDFAIAVPFTVALVFGLAMGGWWLLFSAAGLAGLIGLAVRYYRSKSRAQWRQWASILPGKEGSV